MSRPQYILDEPALTVAMTAYEQCTQLPKPVVSQRRLRYAIRAYLWARDYRLKYEGKLPRPKDLTAVLEEWNLEEETS